jgi:hypothetical protein
MKLYKRLLMTTPFVAFAFAYYKFWNPDYSCQGMADIAINFIFYPLLIITVILALVGAVRKRQSANLKAEPITLSIILLTILFLIYNSTLRGHTNGDKWICAESKNSSLLSTQDLTLRKNGNFTVDLNHADFGCSISGRYKKSGDTIVLEEAAINRTDEKMTTTYLVRSNQLIPLLDTANKTTFDIKEIK